MSLYIQLLSIMYILLLFILLLFIIYLFIFFLDNKVDVRKYLINEKETPFTNILIHAYKEHNGTNLIESKNYAIGSDIPGK